MDAIKPLLRALKRLERRMRQTPFFRRAQTPVYDLFFRGANARYGASALARMSATQLGELTRAFVLALCAHYIGAVPCAGRPGRERAQALAQLGLPPDADADLIKRRFRELAKRLHPDTGGDTAEFQRLMALYDCLQG